MHRAAILEKFGINGVDYGQGGGYDEECTTDFSGEEETDRYWYHPDHLGSSSFITGIDGEVNQNIEYFPSGETFVENHLNSYNVPYKFNSKELDDETGYYYYGARYYNPRVSLWLGVDPLASYDPMMNAEHYIDGQHNGGVLNSGNLNPYIYCYQSPVVYLDPNGKQVHSSKKPTFGYDSGFSKFPKEKPTWADRWNYTKWYAKGIAAVDSYYLYEAGRAYIHYMGGTGKNYKFDLDDYLSDDNSGKALLSNTILEAKANTQLLLPIGGNASYYSERLDSLYPETENWQKAIGAANFYYQADVVSNLNVNGTVTYKMKLTIYGEDLYNFNPGQADIASGTPDAINGRFEVVGYAKQFMQYGSYSTNISWTVKANKTPQLEKALKLLQSQQQNKKR